MHRRKTCPRLASGARRSPAGDTISRWSATGHDSSRGRCSRERRAWHAGWAWQRAAAPENAVSRLTDRCVRDDAPPSDATTVYAVTCATEPRSAVKPALQDIRSRGTSGIDSRITSRKRRASMDVLGSRKRVGFVSHGISILST